MTQEDLKTIYNRATQYMIAKLNQDIRNICIEPDGTLSGEYLESRGCCGDPDEWAYFYFGIEELSSDLDVIIEERKKKEAEAAEKLRIKQEQDEKDRKVREKQHRKEQYLKLKKEFE